MIRIACTLITLLFLFACSEPKRDPDFKYAVIISANMEWKSLKKLLPPAGELKRSPWGEYFINEVGGQQVLFFHQGWGKVAAAAGTQYVIDQWHPQVLINLGTCGGFEGEIKKFDTVLADSTIIYDIREAMGDSKEAIKDYATSIDLSWLGDNLPDSVIVTTLISADQDLRPTDIQFLKENYKAKAGDWESGAIAYTATRNNTRLLILRGVTDIVSPAAGEAYGNFELFASRTDTVMNRLMTKLPNWIKHIEGREK
jgi:adenosylhomocysteine nucleosidase